MASTSVNPRLGPYSTVANLTRLDGRSRESRLLRDVTAELTSHLGGSPSATQRLMINRAAQLSLRIAMMDAEGSADLSERNARQYLAFVNSLTRLLRQLGLHGVRPPAPTLRDHLVQRQPAAAP